MTNGALSAPTVSVILPTFERLDYTKLAIESVFSQSFNDWELLIADDGSSADLRTYLSGLSDRRVRVLWLSHCGVPSITRNAAIRRARGSYLAFLDSDDLWAPTKLEMQVASLRAQPQRRWNYTAVAKVDAENRVFVDETLRKWRPWDGNIIVPLLRLDAHIATPAVMAERQLVEEVGLFDEAQRFGEDYDLWLRLALRSEVSVIPERLTYVRVSHAHYSTDRVSAYEGWIQLYTKMAGILPDPAHRDLARRLRVNSTLTLAGLFVDAHDRKAVLSTLAAGSRQSWAFAAWWWGAAKTLSRTFLPESVRALYLRSKKARWRA